MGCNQSNNRPQSNKTEAYTYSFYKGYKTDADLKNFDDGFFAPDTTSVCSKVLTREVWDEYKDQKDEFGVPFTRCVFTGIANQDSKVGLHSGSHKGYYQFKKLFDPAIEMYHGHPADAKHPTDMSAEGLTNV